MRRETSEADRIRRESPPLEEGGAEARAEFIVLFFVFREGCVVEGGRGERQPGCTSPTSTPNVPNAPSPPSPRTRHSHSAQLSSHTAMEAAHQAAGGSDSPEAEEETWTVGASFSFL